MFKTFKFLYEKIVEHEFIMIPLMFAFTVISAIYPFIWVIVPAKIISLLDSGNIRVMVYYVLTGGILAIISVMGMEFLRGNFRMRMNKVRYFLIRDLIDYSLDMPYENTLHPDEITKIELADQAVAFPTRGAGGIILISLSLFGNIIASLGFIGVIGTLSPIMIIFIGTLVGLTFYFYRIASKYEESTWKASRSDMWKYFNMANLLSDPLYNKDIRVYSLKNIIESYCSGLFGQAKLVFKSIADKNIKMESLVVLLNLIRDISIFGYISYLLYTNVIEASQFFLYITSTITLMTILQTTFIQLSDIKKESKRLSYYIELMEEKAGFSKEGIDEGLRTKLNTDSFKIDFVNVYFKYPESETYVLENFNLSINAGEKMAIVGENGSGKSTLIKLLCKLYKPTIGNIYINGVDIESLPKDEYWKFFGVVFQDAMIFPFSIKENIVLNEEIDEKMLAKSVLKSDMKLILDGLPKGIDTVLLRTLDDDGIDLSGGQKQKLYLARAVYKEFKIMILDEPTAALDPLAESELYNQYDSLSSKKTSVFISHRLASTKFCDRIAYLSDGKIIEIGSHVDLLKQNGKYKELFDIQAKYYKDSSISEEVSYEI
ncbi:MAG: ABC transporter ATP-binding protein [Tissierellia bacterium]|nr:ABC transporter ATP-binding protein [Tissierellia bacterium]